MKRPHTHAERTTILNGVLCFVLILAVLQLWLLTATINACLAGDEAVVWPAAVASLVCAALNYPLFRYLRDAETARSSSSTPGRSVGSALR